MNWLDFDDNENPKLIAGAGGGVAQPTPPVGGDDGGDDDEQEDEGKSGSKTPSTKKPEKPKK